MQKRNPEGYRKLLAYQKASELQVFTNQFVANLPKTKTFFDLADQMSRSGRSGSKNIVEGWKRNTTKEYFDFLGFSIGAVEELKDDAADIATGVYPNLMGLKGRMGEMGVMGEMGTPSTLFSPSSPLTLLIPLSRAELDSIKFYPLNPNLPAVVQLFLRAKELNFLLHKLQQSLDVKMDKEFTKPVSQRVRDNWSIEKQADDEFKKYLKDSGLIRLENGRYITKEELAKMEKEKRDKGEPGGIPLFPD
jgi:four helix bundle protein